jgi:hypothetical protein
MTSSHISEKGKPAGHCKCSKCSFAALACPDYEGFPGVQGVVGQANKFYEGSQASLQAD